MGFIKCQRNTSYGVGGGKFLDLKDGGVYEIGKDISNDIASQMISSRTAIAYEKPTKATLVSENKAMDSTAIENKKVAKSPKKRSSK